MVKAVKFRIGIQCHRISNIGIIGGMTIDHYRNVQALTEIIQNDSWSSGISTAVTGTHGPWLIQKQADCQFRDLIGQIVLIKHLAVIPAQCVSIQTAAHDKPGLFTASPVFLELLEQTLLQLAGNIQQRSWNSIVLFHKLLIHRGNPVDSDRYSFMDIPIGNVLSDIVKLLNPFILQLLTGRLFCHLI